MTASERISDAPQAAPAAPYRFGHRWMLAALSLLLIAGLWVFSPGLFIVDEALYSLAARTFANTQGFTIENGWARHHSENLRTWLLMRGPGGLTPQYPAGQAVISAPFYAALGNRGLMLMNVLAACGTLFATNALAIRWTNDRAAALAAVILLVGATFWLDYVHAVWPQSIAVLSVVLALLATTIALDEDRLAARYCVGAGAAVGAGMLFRTDPILALPALGLALFLFSTRPIRANAWLTAGIVPFLILISAMNFIKFGTFNPLSYGRSDGGGTTLSHHWPALVVLGAGGLLVIGARLSGWKPSRRIVLAGLAACCLAALLIQPVGAMAMRYLFGAWALGIDATWLAGTREGIVAQPDGTASFWGFWKKALAQSVPWFGLVAAAAWQPTDARFRRAQLIVLIVAAAWTLPFFMTAWEGGFGSNMRYMLPLLPLLTVVAAKQLADIAREAGENSHRWLGAGFLAGVILLVGWTLAHPSGAAGAQQVLPTWIFFAIVVAALGSGVQWPWQGGVRRVCLLMVGVGLCASCLNLTLDIATTQRQRAKDWNARLEAAHLPDKALIYTVDPHITDWGFRPGRLVAMPIRTNPKFDPRLIDRALDDGFRVLVHSEYDTSELAERYGERLVPSRYSYDGIVYLEVLPAGKGRAR